MLFALCIDPLTDHVRFPGAKIGTAIGQQRRQPPGDADEEPGAYLGGGKGVVGVERRTPPVQVGEQREPAGATGAAEREDSGYVFVVQVVLVVYLGVLTTL